MLLNAIDHKIGILHVDLSFREQLRYSDSNSSSQVENDRQLRTVYKFASSRYGKQRLA